MLTKIRALFLATQRVWLAAAAVALVGLGSHAACEPIADALSTLTEKLGWGSGFARGVTVAWELLADAVLVSAALRVRDRAPNASLGHTLSVDAHHIAQLASHLRRRFLFWLRPIALVCFVAAGAVSVGRLVGGQLFASLHSLSDLLARFASRAAAITLPALVMLALLLPLVREALFIAVTRTDRSVHIRGRAYPRELLLALPVLPLAFLAAHQASRWWR